MPTYLAGASLSLELSQDRLRKRLVEALRDLEIARTKGCRTRTPTPPPERPYLRDRLVPWRGVFTRWTDSPDEFAQVVIDEVTGAPHWPGDLDVAPDRLYAEVAVPAKVSRHSD